MLCRFSVADELVLCVLSHYRPSGSVYRSLLKCVKSIALLCGHVFVILLFVFVLFQIQSSCSALDLCACLTVSSSQLS